MVNALKRETRSGGGKEIEIRSHGQKILKKELMVFAKRIINLGFFTKGRNKR